MRSIANLVSALGEEVEFFVYTQDRDWLATEPYPGVPLRSWVRVGAAWVYYEPPSRYGIRSLRGIVRDVQPSFVYFNSFFTGIFGGWLAFSVIQWRAPDAIIAPRGQFGTGALRLKWLKKACFLSVALPLIGVLGDRIVFHASTELERSEIAHMLRALTPIGWLRGILGAPRTRVAVAGNLAFQDRIFVAPDLTTATEISSETRRPPKVPGRARLVFCSRISRKKNIAWLFPLLSRVKGDISFDVFGEFDDVEYERECREAAGRAQNAIVNFPGRIAHSDVIAKLSTYDLMVLPTLNENFGHAIAEALAGGCPVLISDQTPWRPEAYGCGWAIPLSSPQAWVNAMQEVVDMSGETHVQCANAARLYSRTASSSTAIEANRELFVSSRWTGA